MTYSFLPFDLYSGIAASVIGGLILAVILGPFRLWLNRRREIKRWYQDAKVLTARVERLGYRATEYQEKPDVEVLQDSLESLSDELVTLAENAPDDNSKREVNS